MLLEHTTTFVVKSVVFLLTATSKIKGNLALILLQKFQSKYLFVCTAKNKEQCTELN